MHIHKAFSLTNKDKNCRLILTLHHKFNVLEPQILFWLIPVNENELLLKRLNILAHVTDVIPLSLSELANPKIHLIIGSQTGLQISSL